MTEKPLRRKNGGLQVQPLYALRDEWRALAEKEGLRFEVLELSAPPALFESRRFESCREWYRKSGLAASLHGVFIDVNPGSADAAFCALSEKRCMESCKQALSLGASNVIFHCSCSPFLRGSYVEYWAGKCASFYEKLAEQYDLNLFIENSSDLDAGPLQKLMNRISSPRIGVCLDLGHAFYSRMPLEHWFESLGDRIGYLHLSDNLGLYDDHLAIGDGRIDWETADALFRGLGREMPMTLEVGALDSVKKSLEYLRAHHYFGQ